MVYKLRTWVRPVVKITSRILVDDEICSVHPPTRTLEINTERYFGEKNGDQKLPGMLKSPANGSGPVSSKSLIGKISD